MRIDSCVRQQSPRVLIAQTTPPRATIRETAEEYHGKRISDPYRWMENMKDESFMSWLKGQNEHARETIAGIPGRDRIAARLNEVTTAVASVTTPRRAHGRMFYLKRLPDEDVGSCTC